MHPRLILLSLLVALGGCDKIIGLWEENAPRNFVLPIYKLHYNWTPDPSFAKESPGPPPMAAGRQDFLP